MRTLSDELTVAQKLVVDPLIKLVLRSGDNYKAYTREDMVFSRHIEQPDTFNALAALRNQDNAFYDLALKGYTAQLSYGYTSGKTPSAWEANTAYTTADGADIGDLVIPTTANGWVYRCQTAGTSHATTEPTWTTNLGQLIEDGTVVWEVWCRSGQEYSLTAPMTVVAQQENSAPISDFCYLSMAGIPNVLAQEKASQAYRPASGDTSTVKDILAVIFSTSMTCFSHCVAYTVVWDSEDSLIDSFIPADKFVIAEGESRLSAVNKLFGFTDCVWLPKNDGKIHVINPTVSGVSYDYSYALGGSNHQFFSKTYRERLIIPNKITVNSPADAATQYTGSTTDAASYALFPIEAFYRANLASDAEGVDMAGAILQKIRLASDQGNAKVPMNCGAELWDYNLVTGAYGETRTGNNQSVERVWSAYPNKKASFNMNFGFGKPNAGGELGTSIPGLEGDYERAIPGNYLALFDALNKTDKALDERLSELEDTDNQIVTIPVMIYDGGGVIAASETKVWFPIDFACTIKAVELLADQTGSIVIDIWKGVYSSYDDSDSICAAALPTISSAKKAEDTTLTGWTKTINKGDILFFWVDSCSTITKCTISLKVERI